MRNRLLPISKQSTDDEILKDKLNSGIPISIDTALTYGEKGGFY